MSAGAKPFDIVVCGATGFVGQLVADHLTDRYQTAELNLALGGRNESKLNQLAGELTRNNGLEKEPPILIGDAT